MTTSKYDLATSAKDIPDADFLAAVVKHGPYAMTWDLIPELGAPDKVVRAKARKLIKRGLLDGCACGCRGDFTLGPMADLADRNGTGIRRES